MQGQWLAHITVASIVEDNGRFLLVEELKGGQLVLNQPAGHLEPNESLEQAVIRETYEETGWHIQPSHVLGVYRYTAPSNGVTYYRTTFIAKALQHDDTAVLDKDIERALWLSYDEIVAQQHRLRSPLVLNNIEHYLAGMRYPLALLHDHE